jgi:hypothetical protein
MVTPRMKRLIASELPLALVSLTIATLAVDLVIAARPAALTALRAGLQHFVDTGAGWPGLFAASVGVAASAISAVVVARFIRGVQAAPYVWIAPWLLGACAWLMGTIPARLPLPMSPFDFAVLSALLLIGGGEVFMPRSLLRSLTGGLLICAPFVMLIIGYAQQTTPIGFDSKAQLYGAALGFSAILTIALSLTTHRMQAERDAERAREQQSDQLRAQVVELLERCSASEARARAAEQQLARLGYAPIPRR